MNADSCFADWALFPTKGFGMKGRGFAEMKKVAEGTAPRQARIIIRYLSKLDISSLSPRSLVTSKPGCLNCYVYTGRISSAAQCYSCKPFPSSSTLSILQHLLSKLLSAHLSPGLILPNFRPIVQTNSGALVDTPAKCLTTIVHHLTQDLQIWKIPASSPIRRADFQATKKIRDDYKRNMARKIPTTLPVVSNQALPHQDHPAHLATTTGERPLAPFRQYPHKQAISHPLSSSTSTPRKESGERNST